jgi:opacity protein-like surface antigen
MHTDKLVTLIVGRDRLSSLPCEGDAAAVVAGSSSKVAAVNVQQQQQQQQQHLWALMVTTLRLTAAAIATVTASLAHNKCSEADRVGTAAVLSVTLVVTVSVATVTMLTKYCSAGRRMQKLLQQH